MGEGLRNLKSNNMEIAELKEAVDGLVAKGYKPHHTASRKGYITKSQGHIDKYSGRFGVGYIVWWPWTCKRVSNRYIAIEYLIK